MYGATHVVAIDRHSRFVVAASKLLIKNNIVYYDQIYRYGLNYTPLYLTMNLLSKMYDLSDIDENDFGVVVGFYPLQGTKLVCVSSSFSV